MRLFQSSLKGEFLKQYQQGVLRYTYRDVLCMKSPIDIAIYLRAIWELKPRTILEMGSQAGGSALMFADFLSIYCIDAHVYSIDIAPPENIVDERITFIEGDVRDLKPTFDQFNLTDAPHPWLVTEDSAHTFEGCIAALRFLSEVMVAGDLLVMEDGNLKELGLEDQYNGGPSRAIKTFMVEEPGSFEIDRRLCDMFGPNATYNPNGYLRKS